MTTIIVSSRLAVLFIAKLKRLRVNPVLLTRNYSPSVRCTEVEVDSGPSHTAMVYYRAISEAEMGSGCAAFPTAAFGTATDPRRRYYSGFP